MKNCFLEQQFFFFIPILGLSKKAVDMQKMSIESLEEWLNAPPKQLSKAEEKSLFKPKYLDSLIQFVGQNNGKKSKQIESILESMMQWCFLNKRQEYLQNIYDFLSVNKASLKTTWLIMWFIILSTAHRSNA